MRASIITGYGDYNVVKVMGRPEPVPKANELLIKVMSSCVNSGDARIRRADPWFVRLAYGLNKPKQPVLGVVFAGIIAQIGSDVQGYEVGRRVYGMCENNMGAHAEYMTISHKDPIAFIPDQMSFAEAAALPFGATTALHYLDGIEVQGKTMLINGASGAVGSAFLQIAKAEGARVTTLSSATNIELLLMLGADKALDYKVTTISDMSEEYDIVVDCVNNHKLSDWLKLTKKGGNIFLVAGLVGEMLRAPLVKKAKVKVGPAKATPQHYQKINRMFEMGQLKPVIGEVLTLDKIAKAHQMVDSGHKVGNLVIEINK